MAREESYGTTDLGLGLAQALDVGHGDIELLGTMTAAGGIGGRLQVGLHALGPVSLFGYASIDSTGPGAGLGARYTF